ncbi:uncharacterized protein LOC129234373 [Uloborus diversus]|uniref:uncharacterized protein LOC129234373 n=1 Tax=Uloborus diversus TaxID=327109 RepID=UPI00240940E9|nr:uncharacterized protein LOC129234373 [Uloborus diversus]
MCSQLRSGIKRDVAELEEKMNICPSLSALDKEIEKHKKKNVLQWRPSGDPEKDFKAHAFMLKNNYRAELEAKLQKLQLENDELRNVMAMEHSEIMRIKKENDENQRTFSEVLYLCAAICFISLATCQSYRRQRSAVEHHDVEDGTSHYEYLNSLHEHKSIPYNFGYDIKDDKGFNHWHKEESDEHNVKKGSYGYTDAYGIYRHVDYIADHDGFRATVRTNEPGTANYSPAHAHYHVDLPPPDVYKSYSTLKHVDDLPEEYEDKITGTNKRFSLVPVYDSHKSFEE